MRRHCPNCEGTGVLPKVKCQICAGAGTREYTSDYEVGLPPGVTGGATSVQGKGAPGLYGGPHGDLLIEVSVKFPDVDIDSVSPEEIDVLKKYLG